MGRQAEQLLYLGELCSVEKAERIGLIDESCPSSKLDDIALERAEEYLLLPDHARQATKWVTRHEMMDWFDSERENDINRFIAMVTNDSVQKTMGMYLQMLKAKSQKRAK